MGTYGADYVYDLKLFIYLLLYVMWLLYIYILYYNLALILGVYSTTEERRSCYIRTPNKEKIKQNINTFIV